MENIIQASEIVDFTLQHGNQRSELLSIGLKRYGRIPGGTDDRKVTVGVGVRR